MASHTSKPVSFDGDLCASYPSLSTPPALIAAHIQRADHRWQESELADVAARAQPGDQGARRVRADRVARPARRRRGRRRARVPGMGSHAVGGARCRPAQNCGPVHAVRQRTQRAADKGVG